VVRLGTTGLISVASCWPDTLVRERLRYRAPPYPSLDRTTEPNAAPCSVPSGSVWDGTRLADRRGSLLLGHFQHSNAASFSGFLSAVEMVLWLLNPAGDLRLSFRSHGSADDRVRLLGRCNFALASIFACCILRAPPLAIVFPGVPFDAIGISSRPLWTNFHPKRQHRMPRRYTILNRRSLRLAFLALHVPRGIAL